VSGNRNSIWNRYRRPDILLERCAFGKVKVEHPPKEIAKFEFFPESEIYPTHSFWLADTSRFRLTDGLPFHLLDTAVIFLLSRNATTA